MPSKMLGCRVVLAATILALCFCGALASKEKVYLDGFGGDPVVSSEVGAEPKDVDDPELLMPTGTCQMPGIELKECSHDCVYGCDTPMCTWGCVCSCNSVGAKSKLLAFLREQSRSTQVLAAQNSLSKAVTAMEVNAEQPKQQEGEGFLSNPFSGIKFPAKKKKGVNPRLEGHKLAKANQAKIARKIARQRRRLIETQFVDGGNFDWSAYGTPQKKDPPELAGYAAESANINDVFDPMEDPYNVGDKKEVKGRWWAHDTQKEGFTENWWAHGKHPH